MTKLPFDRLRQLAGALPTESARKDDDIRFTGSVTGKQPQRDRLYRSLLLNATETGCEITHYAFADGDNDEVTLSFEIVGRTRNLDRFRAGLKGVTEK